MDFFNSITVVSPFSETKNRSYLYKVLLVVACLICGGYFIGDRTITNGYRETISKWYVQKSHTEEKIIHDACESHCRPQGSEALPEGIVVKTSNLQLRPLWDSSTKHESPPSTSLLAIAAGIKQKEIVSKIVEKFLPCGFRVMLFHYDDVVDEWRDLGWNDNVIHISAANQTKWWFAKRFLHPDIVAEYDYIFLWDQDLAVENFHPQKYLDIIKSEGLEISQPALDPSKSVVHHPMTARNKHALVHRRYYKFNGNARCDDNSAAPPCTGWVEMMAPVFSKAAWRCVWYMIQNDLIHAWGLDRQLGYCAQGDRIQNVGVVDSEYIVHLGLPTLGVTESSKGQSEPQRIDNRVAVRRQSYVEMQIFKKRWDEAVVADKCWIDPYAPLSLE